MHQPEYRDLKTGEYVLPWTYLHAIKDYVDMVAHLEAVPAARAVVNFAPILIEQIQDYDAQIHQYFQTKSPLKDPLLATLVTDLSSLTTNEKINLIENCKKANKERQIDRYPAYGKLYAMGEWLLANPDALYYVEPQFLIDLSVWYHLAWTGETVKRRDKRIQQLIEKAQDFNQADRQLLLQVIQEIIAGILPRYKTLAEQGRIELSVTPYAHPIMPLLLDFDSAREAMPDVVLPNIEGYPGGEQRVRWHLQKGLEVFSDAFGFTPQGCWPSEGSLSEATLKILDEFGFDWTASGGNVLRNSLAASGQDKQTIHHPFQVEGTAITCFFRDDGLSDLIGFEYSKWHADHAVSDLIHHLENICHFIKEDGVVSIIMDGENAWEYFPENGYYFLSALYQRLSESECIELTTFSECLEQQLSVIPLQKLVAGSWVYGTFSTWIGDQAKNRGWEMLAEAKQAYDEVVDQNTLTGRELAEAEKQLAVCEGSDWFWWFGDYNPGDAVSAFEKQFRLNLKNLYYLIGVTPPDYLSQTFTQGSGSPDRGGAMRRGSEKSINYE
jgi:alpha-amylase/alpha-mannosidase (GH57 family)